MLHEIGLTDFYFKELLTKSPDYLLLLINGICNLNLKKEDITLGNTEERDGVTFKTIAYDIKVVSQDMHIDIEAQKNIVNTGKNEYNDYIYDISRAIYYLCMLHSRSYDYREKGYTKKKSIVIFLYRYDIAGEEIIQKTCLHNTSRDIHYDDIVLYSISLEKISKDSKMELHRALKLLTETDLDSYKNDESRIVKEAADLLEGYDKTEEAENLRFQRQKEEYEKGIMLQTAKDEGKEEKLIENIKTMSSNGASNEMISKLLNLDISYVNEVLKK